MKKRIKDILYRVQLYSILCRFNLNIKAIIDIYSRRLYNGMSLKYIDFINMYEDYMRDDCDPAFIESEYYTLIGALDYYSNEALKAMHEKGNSYE